MSSYVALALVVGAATLGLLIQWTAVRWPRVFVAIFIMFWVLAIVAIYKAAQTAQIISSQGVLFRSNW